MDQREILGLEREEIAQHLGLAPVAMENRMRQKRRQATEPLVKTGVGIARHVIECEVGHVAAIEYRPQVDDVGACRGFIKGDGQCPGRKHSQVEMMGVGGGQDVFLSVRTNLHANRVEVVVVQHGKTQLFKT